MDRVSFIMTQDQFADALALTNVHVNRMLRTLADEGMIERTKRSVRIVNVEQLRRIGDFDKGYLHLDRLRLQDRTPLLPARMAGRS